MPDNADPIIQASNLLVTFMQEEDLEPMAAMAAMTQLAAKIAFDSAQQEKLSEEEARNRWMGGAMLAYDAAAGGKAGFDIDPKTGLPATKPRHLQLCAGVGKGSKKGFNHRREKNRQRNKQARKTRRTNRGNR